MTTLALIKIREDPVNKKRTHTSVGEVMWLLWGAICAAAAAESITALPMRPTIARVTTTVALGGGGGAGEQWCIEIRARSRTHKAYF